MKTSSGSEYFEEEKLGKPYDIKILKRLWPFIRPYRAWLICSCVLIVLITLIDLSVPYITKIAIDSYIVPELGNRIKPSGAEPKIRFLSIHISDPDTDRIVRKYPDRFRVEGGYAMIPFDDLPELERKDIVILRKNDLSGVGFAALIFLFAVSVSFALNFLQFMIMEYTGQKVMHDLRMRLFSHIQSLSPAFFTRNPVGRLVTRVTNDVQNMQEVFGSMIVFIFKDMLLILGVTLILFDIDRKLAMISLAVIPFILISSVTFANQAREAFRIMRVKVAEINTRFSETISGIKIVQLFRLEMKNYRDFEALNHDHYSAGIRQIRVFAVFLRFMGFLDVFVIAIVIFYGGTGVLSGSMSLGALVAFIAYIKMFFGPIRDLAQKYNIMQNAMSSAERILLLLDSQEKLPAGGPLQLTTDHKPLTIEMTDVSFAYVEEETVLKGISLKVRAGEAVAVVGPTGSGKTSLINLIIRFYDPVSGRVSINGRDIRESDISDLRSKMALVTQDPFLFSGTIRENIFHGVSRSQAPTREQERREEYILTASNCKLLVDRLPDGLDTELSEGGASISSGERQLISIARAFARDPYLIILDEATSYIDSETEVNIQEALANLMRNRTSVIVAHRLSTTRHADRIIVLHKGRIIETGTHESLMKLRGFYFKLNQLQG
ncbi:ABC transporter ATP-binding protein [Desulfobacterales bacterium HSG2]|nr:ABC transporter ATP-binding protein [Desulfobacterales bacterium HSG2]